MASSHVPLIWQRVLRRPLVSDIITFVTYNRDTTIPNRQTNERLNKNSDRQAMDQSKGELYTNGDVKKSDVTIHPHPPDTEYQGSLCVDFSARMVFPAYFGTFGDGGDVKIRGMQIPRIVRGR